MRRRSILPVCKASLPKPFTGREGGFLAVYNRELGKNGKRSKNTPLQG